MKLSYITFSAILVLFFSALYGQTQKSSFFKVDSIQQIAIEFKDDKWQQSLDSLYLNGDEYMMAKVTINGQSYSFSGVRYAKSLANSTRSTKNSFEIKLNFINQTNNYMGSKNIVLSQSLRDPSLARNVLYTEMAQDQMVTPRANYASLTINNSFYGVMVNIEAVDDVFIERRFQNKEGTFLSCSVRDNKTKRRENGDNCLNNTFANLSLEPSPTCYFDDYQLLSEGGWDDLMNLSKVLKDKSSSIEELEKVLNIDQTLWYLALNNLTVSFDSYLGRDSRNYYLYKDKNGQFHIIPWAANLAFGSLKAGRSGSDLSIEEMTNLEPMFHADNQTKPLIQALFRHQELRKKYLAFYRSLYDKYMGSKWFVGKIDSLQEIIRPYREMDTTNYYSMDDFEASTKKIIGKLSKIPPLTKFLMERRSFLKQQSFVTTVPPEVTAVRFKRREAFSDEKIENFTVFVTTENYAKKARLYFAMNDTTLYKPYQLSDNGKAPDEKAGDGIFSGTIPATSSGTMNYYIRVENAQVEKYFPQDFVFNKDQISLEELNK